jgi:predicted ATPase/DNA-binding winged helix-turn-helix (wHTH) protein
MEILTTAKFRFGEYEMDCGRRSLTRDGEPMSLNSKAFDLLQQLVENHGSVLTKDDLLTSVWPGQFVEENNLTVHISALRKALGEMKNEHRYIVTVPGRGYSFIERVESVDVESRSPRAKTADDLSGLVNGTYATETGNAYTTESIFGRDGEIAEIKELLQQGREDVRLVILTGPGGSGKTRLAHAVAGELSTTFPDGIAFVELAAVRDAEFVAPAIAQALGLKESGESLPLESLKTFLSGRQMLLILDNFEQLTEATSVVRNILTSSPKLKVLVTSRIALRVNNEREFAVPPLSFPPKGQELSADQLSEYAAIRLFVARARNANRNFVLSDANAAAVAEISRRLDGLPLAIELAAARVKLLSAQSILSRLENSLRLLTGGAIELPERQRTIRAAIEWSYDLLDEDAKIMFQRVSVFAGGFSVEAAESLVSGQFSDLIAPLDLLTSLVDNSLLFAREETDDGVRLQMLGVVREFALEYLEKSGEAEDVRRLHADFFLSLAEEAEPFLFSGQSIDWLEKLETENDNLRAALKWLLDHPERRHGLPRQWANSG